MSDRLERVLEVLDGAGQTSTEEGYGTDWNPGHCARCQRHAPAEGGELCPGCRAFLLDDTDVDPRNPPRPDPDSIEGYIRARLEEAIDARLWGGSATPEGITDVIVVVQAAGVTMREAADAIADLFRPVVQAMADLVNSVDWLAIERALDEVRSRPAPERRTLNTWPEARLAPHRDLRATEAPRRPPTTPRRLP